MCKIDFVVGELMSSLYIDSKLDKQRAESEVKRKTWQAESNAKRKTWQVQSEANRKNGQ